MLLVVTRFIAKHGGGWAAVLSGFQSRIEIDICKQTQDCCPLESGRRAFEQKKNATFFVCGYSAVDKVENS